MEKTRQAKMGIVEWVKKQIQCWKDGLLTAVELVDVLEKGYNGTRGGYSFSRRVYTGYNYRNQCWVTLVLK